MRAPAEARQPVPRTPDGLAGGVKPAAGVGRRIQGQARCTHAGGIVPCFAGAPGAGPTEAAALRPYIGAPAGTRPVRLRGEP